MEVDQKFNEVESKGEQCGRNDGPPDRIIMHKRSQHTKTTKMEMGEKNVK